MKVVREQFSRISNAVVFLVDYLKREGVTMLLYRLALKYNDPRSKLASYLTGSGIEIGALHNPMQLNKRRASVRYVDYKTTDEIRISNPELKNISLVNVDILGDAENLSNLNDSSENFIILNHVFEHLKNPLIAIKEWHRVLRDGGIVYLTVPDKTRTFDKNRERTSLEHIVQDFNTPNDERDFGHYIEFAEMLLKTYQNVENPRKKQILAEALRLKQVNYSIHYHVFIEEDVREIIAYAKKKKIADFDIIDSKPLLKNPSDIEFTLILKCNKG